MLEVQATKVQIPQSALFNSVFVADDGGLKVEFDQWATDESGARLLISNEVCISRKQAGDLVSALTYALMNATEGDTSYFTAEELRLTI